MTKYVVLCEDNQSACFIRRFLNIKNVDKREIRENIAPLSSGSGEQYVRNNHPKELESCRQHGSNLIVCSDADKGTVANRIKMLDNECKTQEIDIKNSNEKVAMIIPKRNIETWLEFLNENNSVDENIDYKKGNKADKKRCQNAVKKLDSLCEQKQSLPLKSLDLSCAEAKKIGF